MRLFIAIDLSDAARQHLERVQAALRSVAPGASFTRPDNLHLTLKFLGETPDAQVPALCSALAPLAPAAPLELATTAMVCFPPHGPLRIIGAQLGPLEPALRELQHRIEQACESLGHARENRAYRAHVTLARARQPLRGQVRQQLEDATAAFWPGPLTTVRQFVLYQSQLNPKGSIYTPLARF